MTLSVSKFILVPLIVVRLCRWVLHEKLRFLVKFVQTSRWHSVKPEVMLNRTKPEVYKILDIFEFH